MMHARMGSHIQMYEPEDGNIHRLINQLVTRPARAFLPSAVIVQEKHFPDVSMYQREVDWEVMRSQTDAAIIRAGQNLWEDPQFRRNWAEARRVGMTRGLYWFYDDRIDPGRQADLLISLIGDDLPEMEIYCDWEHSYGGAFGGLRNVVAFMQRVEERLPVHTGLYTGYYFFRDHSNALTNAAQYAWLRSRPLWLAWYVRDPSVVLIPAPWSSLLLWQWGTPAVGPMWGVQSIELDMNTFNGSMDEFELRYGGEPPVEEPMENTWYRVNTSVLNMRGGPGAGYPDVGDFLAGDMIETEANVSGWLKVVRYIRGNAILHANPAVFCKDSYCVQIANPLPPPEPEPAPTLPDLPVTITLGDDVTYAKQTVTVTLKPK